MKILPILIVAVILSVTVSIPGAFATHLDNKGLDIESTGFAINDDSIKTSEVTITSISQKGTISSTSLSIQDGFVTLDDTPYAFSKITGSLLRDAKYFRVNGALTDSDQEIGTLSLFGKQIHESKEGLVYSVTGKIVVNSISYKVVYTSKISIITSTPTKPTDTTDTSNIIKILKGSSDKGNVKYLSETRTKFPPGTTITFVNEDIVSHTLLSGKENYGDRYIPFTADGRINVGEIPPGSSKQITFDEMGFYRIFDPDYPWINTTFYVFPETNSQQIRDATGPNQSGN